MTLKNIKTIICFCLSASLIPPLEAQISSLAYDTTYQSAYYLQKISIHEMVKDSKNEIVFLGNSITDIGHWDEFFPKANVLNRGISSDITYGVLYRLHQITRLKPAKLFVMIGINDIARNIPDAVILSNYKKIIQQVKMASPKTKIYIQSILPTNQVFNSFINHQHKFEHIRFVNEGLQVLAKEFQISYLDTNALLSDSDGLLDARYTNDGLHLNGTGYQVWIDFLKKNNYCCP